ncbi:2Fe-2S ferredoxin-type domain-containing protein [Tribonema minus]|uniref:2Fe-2S ferredoxin-type domain-containing protein n=1 Tax=Tribonema minus TaxID=303371 RepID=A0A836C6V2_9STRA|nr:2Fe-2S ferredoxin-type domain-containing protein [Tribonema minus]
MSSAGASLARLAARQWRRHTTQQSTALSIHRCSWPWIAPYCAAATQRCISSTRTARHGDESEFANAPNVTINWRNKHGEVRTVDAPVGMNLMRVAHKHDIELEGACEGVCACSTCHVILEDDIYAALPEPSEDEEDMLDQAFGLTATSRLGCQVVVTPEMDGITVTLPAATRNFYVDGHVPKPH